MTWFKFLAEGAVGPFSGYRWPAPRGSDTPGEWVVAPDRLDPCRAGLHVCRPGDLSFWLQEELYTVAVEGPVLAYDSFLLTHRARLLRRVEAWRRDLAARFARDCAWRVRDLAVDALRATGRSREADRLDDCETTDDLLHAAVLVAGQGHAPLASYAADTAQYATAAGSQARWSTHAATAAFIAATAARVAAAPAAGQAEMVAERARQGNWLTARVLAAV